MHNLQCYSAADKGGVTDKAPLLHCCQIRLGSLKWSDPSLFTLLVVQ